MDFHQKKDFIISKVLPAYQNEVYNAKSNSDLEKALFKSLKSNITTLYPNKKLMVILNLLF